MRMLYKQYKAPATTVEHFPKPMPIEPKQEAA